MEYAWTWLIFRVKATPVPGDRQLCREVPKVTWATYGGTALSASCPVGCVYVCVRVQRELREKQ